MLAHGLSDNNKLKTIVTGDRDREDFATGSTVLFLPVVFIIWAVFFLKI
jgi:hypothetical protein